MTKENLESLLNSMLDESAVSIAAEEVRAREEAERAGRAAARREEVEAPAVPALDDIGQLTGLTDPDLRSVIARAAPDDLLVVLATADDALQRRISRNLSADSLSWIRANLVHIESVTDHERDGARSKVLKVANALLEGGEIGPPAPESVGTPDAPEAELKELRERLGDLVRIASEGGPAALAPIIDRAGEPLLRDGLELLGGGQRGASLRRSLEARRGELERRYRRRLDCTIEALVAVGEGERPEAFDARVFGGE